MTQDRLSTRVATGGISYALPGVIEFIQIFVIILNSETHCTIRTASFTIYRNKKNKLKKHIDGKYEREACIKVYVAAWLVGNPNSCHTQNGLLKANRLYVCVDLDVLE